MENEDNTILLKDESGNEIEFNVITKLSIENDEYVIVVPSEEDKDEAIALKLQKDEKGKETFTTVDDEQEFNRVCEAYEILFSDSEVN